jgi:hypothetical protein
MMGASTMELSTGQVGATGAYNCQVMADGAETTGSGNAVDMALDAIVPVRGFAPTFDALNDMAVLDEFWCQVDEFAFRPECDSASYKNVRSPLDCSATDAVFERLDQLNLGARLQQPECKKNFFPGLGVTYV